MKELFFSAQVRQRPGGGLALEVIVLPLALPVVLVAFLTYRTEVLTDCSSRAQHALFVIENLRSPFSLSPLTHRSFTIGGPRSSTKKANTATHSSLSGLVLSVVDF